MKIFQNKKFIFFLIILIMIIQAFSLTVLADIIPKHTVTFDLNGFPGVAPESREKYQMVDM